MVALAENSTLAEVYFNDDDNETIDKQVKTVTNWRQRLQPRRPKWNGASAQKNSKDADNTVEANSNRQLDFSASAEDGFTGLDTKHPATTDHFVENNNHSDDELPATTYKFDEDSTEQLYLSTSEDSFGGLETTQQAKKLDTEQLITNDKFEAISEQSDTLESIHEDSASIIKANAKISRSKREFELEDSKVGSKLIAKGGTEVQFNSLDELENVLFMKLNSLKQKTVEHAAQELASLMSGNKENCEKFYHLGGYGVLMATMTRFPNSELVQGTCISVFANVVYQSTLCRNALVATSVLYVVTQATQRFPEHPLVQEMSLQFLWSFLDAGGVKHKFVGELDGIQLVTAAMFFFRNDVDIQKSGCQVLCKLSTSKDIKKQLKKTDAVVCVAIAMNKYPNECEALADDFMTTVFPRLSFSKKRFLPKWAGKDEA